MPVMETQPTTTQTPPTRPGRRPGGGYTLRIRQLLADLVSYETAFGIRELRLHDSYLAHLEKDLVGEELPDDAAISRVLWRLTREGKLHQVRSGRGQGKRALYVAGTKWSAA